MSTIALGAIAVILFTDCQKAGSGEPGTGEGGGTDNSADVRGRVINSSGAGVAGVKITIEHTVWYGNYVYCNTDAQGNYSKNLPADPAGDWSARAQIEKSAWGQSYHFDLDPSSTDYFARGSHAVRNFTWRLSGQKPGGGYYGAHVDMYMCCGSGTPASELKLILTPVEPTLIDGSPAAIIERDVSDIGGGVDGISDVPIGKYRVKALVPGNPAKKIYLDYKRSSSGNYEEEKEVIFRKDGYLGETEYNLEFNFRDFKE